MNARVNCGSKRERMAGEAVLIKSGRKDDRTGFGFDTVYQCSNKEWLIVNTQLQSQEPRT